MPKNSAGQSGTPGRVNKEDKAALKRVKGLARKHTHAAIKSLLEIATDKKAEKRARVAAAIAILDRGYGKPGQTGDADQGAGLGGRRIVLDFVGRTRTASSRQTTDDEA